MPEETTQESRVQETQQLQTFVRRFELIKSRFPSLSSKVENLIFALQTVIHRKGVVEKFYDQLEKRAQLIHISEPGTKAADDALTERMKEEAAQKGKVVTCKVEDQIGWEWEHGLAFDIERNSFITNIVTLLDNCVDFWFTIQRQIAPRQKHWDMTDYLEPGKMTKNVVASDPHLVFLKDAYGGWLTDLNDERERIIHRVPERRRKRINFQRQWQFFPNGEVKTHEHITFVRIDKELDLRSILINHHVANLIQTLEKVFQVFEGFPVLY